MESHAIDMRNSVFGHAFALAVLSVACVGTLRADTPTPAAEVAESRLAPNLAWRYGAWVAKGPRIVSDSGEPLAAARVVELDRHGRNSVELPLDEDGRIVLNCYVNDGKRIKVSCEGYYSRQVTLSSDCGETEIVLRRKRRPHRMLNREIDVMLPMTATNDVIQVDLVEGDLLAPYGYGIHADAEFRFDRPIDTHVALSSHCFVPPRDDSGQMFLLNEGDGVGPIDRAFDDDFGMPYEADDAICTNRMLRCDMFGRGFAFCFRVRGHYGYTKGTPIVGKSQRYVHVRRQSVDRKSMTLTSKPEDCLQIRLAWCINAEPGDRGLEPDERRPSLSPPPERFVPSDTNLLAFGVSPDGRSALCFGCVSPFVRVPDVFPRAVYTAEPAKDLPALETLYIDQLSAEIGAGAFAEHAALRSVVLFGGSFARIQEKAFANCPRLNAFVILRRYDRLVVAEDAFAGCADDFAAIFVGEPLFADADSSPESRGKWTTIPCANVFPRQISVPLDFMMAEKSFGPSVDLDSGRVELPLLRFNGTRLERETSDGKVFSLDNNGRETKRRVAR